MLNATVLRLAVQDAFSDLNDRLYNGEDITCADYIKAFGDVFLDHINNNVVVSFSWDGTGTDVTNGATVADPMVSFVVNGSSGAGTLAVLQDAGGASLASCTSGSLDDVGLGYHEDFLTKLTKLIQGLLVTLPTTAAIPPGTFAPLMVQFDQGGELRVDFSGMDTMSEHDDVLEEFCDRLLESFRANFKSTTAAVRMVASFPNVTGGFNGSVEMASIS